jgi:Na+/melibiose symporter-like transporter
MNSTPISYARLLLLGLGFMGISLLWGIYDAAVPIILQDGRPDFRDYAGVDGYGLSAPLMGSIMTLDNLAALLILPYVGAWSDRLRSPWGRRKPFIAVGAPLAAVGFVAIPFVMDRPLVFFMLAIMATLIAMDLFRTPVIALMPDITPSPQRSQANGVMNLMGGLGTVLGLAGGGLLFEVALSATFLFGALAMLIGCTLVLAFIREPNPDAVERNVVDHDGGPEPDTQELGILDSLRQVFTDRDRSAFYLLGAIFLWFLGFSALQINFSSFAGDRLGLDLGKAMLLLAFFPVSILLFAVPSGMIGVRLGRRRTILIGLVGFAVLLALGYFISTPAMARVILALAGIFWSLILVNSLPMVLDCAPPERLGAYTGLYYLAMQSSAVLSPILVGFAVSGFNNDYRIIFVYGAVTTMLAFVLMWGVRRGEAVIRATPDAARSIQGLE